MIMYLFRIRIRMRIRNKIVMTMIVMNMIVMNMFIRIINVTSIGAIKGINNYSCILFV